MDYTAWMIFAGAALLEVGGDAVVRKGLRGNETRTVVLGFVMLGCYGLVVNTVKWDFSKVLGVYVSVFAAVSLFFGCFVFRETVPASTWLGLGLIMVGGLIIQYGNSV